MKLLRASSLLLFAWCAACPAEPIDPPPLLLCEDDARASTFVTSFTKESLNGLFRLTFEQTSPPIPSRGNNVWELQLFDATGTATRADSLRIRAWMPEHQHGTDPEWIEGELLEVSGRHRVGPFNLFMNGLWELTVEATLGDARDQALFAFCIEDRVLEPDAGVADAGMVDAGAPIECTVTAPSACPAPPVRYADVEPIIASRCLSCHDGRGDQWPLNSYDHAADWYAEIRSMILACSMPPPSAGIPMTNAEREQLLLWVRCGFPP